MNNLEQQEKSHSKSRNKNLSLKVKTKNTILASLPKRNPTNQDQIQTLQVGLKDTLLDPQDQEKCFSSKREVSKSSRMGIPKLWRQYRVLNL